MDNKYRVIVETKEGGTQKFNNVIEYDHKDGDLRMTLEDGSLKEISSDDISNTKIEPMPMEESGKVQEMNE